MHANVFLSITYPSGASRNFLVSHACIKDGELTAALDVGDDGTEHGGTLTIDVAEIERLQVRADF